MGQPKSIFGFIGTIYALIQEARQNWKLRKRTPEEEELEDWEKEHFE